MMREIRAQWGPAVKILLLLTVLLGFVYPATVTVLARIFFPRPADGSLIVKNGRVAGSRLIGQPFDDPKYFWGRPSATSPNPYNSASSSGSNLGPTNPALVQAVQQRESLYQKFASQRSLAIPADLLTASGSGLDPDISPAAAFFQVPRVARARKLSESSLRKIVQASVQERQWGFLGEPRVNVLLLNLALDHGSKNAPISQ